MTYTLLFCKTSLLTYASLIIYELVLDQADNLASKIKKGQMPEKNPACNFMITTISIFHFRQCKGTYSSRTGLIRHWSNQHGLDIQQLAFTLATYTGAKSRPDVMLF